MTCDTRHRRRPTTEERTERQPILTTEGVIYDVKTDRDRRVDEIMARVHAELEQEMMRRARREKGA